MSLIMVASKNDFKASTIKWCLRLSQCILTYSMAILVCEFLFATTFGYRPKADTWTKTLDY